MLTNAWSGYPQHVREPAHLLPGKVQEEAQERAGANSARNSAHMHHYENRHTAPGNGNNSLQAKLSLQEAIDCTFLPVKAYDKFRTVRTLPYVSPRFAPDKRENCRQGQAQKFGP